MSVRRHNIKIPRLSAEDLAAWAEVPAAVTSDALGRAGAMAGAISPIAPSMRIVAQARTVACMVADNSALHAAITEVEPGDVLVCDAQGFEDAAIWGGLMTGSAVERGLAGLVIDGAVRDSAEIVEAGFNVFARAVVPRGPHKGFGGVIDGAISCGGQAVHPGDLIVADADGAVVVPFARVPEALAGAQAILAKEAKAMETVAQGGSLADVYGVPKVELI
ncbi:MAG: RraA family protein [Pseudomonadota bacterium]